MDLRRTRTLLCFFLTVSIGIGCRSEEADPMLSGVEHRMDTVNGAVHVVSTGTPPEWVLTSELEIGRSASVGEAAPDEFGRIMSVTTDDAGRVWVADALSHQIKVFGAEGHPIRAVGREGQGPGEFLGLYSIAWVGDLLLALDFGNGRVAELSETGEWLGSRPAPGRVSGSASMLRFYPVADSTVYQWSLESVDGRLQRMWVEHGPEGVRAKHPQLVVEAPEPSGLTCNRPDGAISFFEIPFAGKTMQHPGQGGLTYVAWSGVYRITAVTPEGDTVRIVERERPPVPITDQEWETGGREFSDFREEWPGAECEPPNMDRPESKPAFRNLLVDLGGRLWVEAFTPSGLQWEIFDPEGRLIATVPAFEYLDRVAPSIRSGRVAWVEQDSLGVERVHVGRVGATPLSN